MQARRSVLLAVAFAALLLVMGVSATAVWWNARTAQDATTELHNAHMSVDGALASIRSDIYLTGILTRDYLLDEDPNADRQYIDQFNEIRTDTDRNFATLEESRLVEDDADALARLRTEIRRQYWDPTISALGWTPAQKEANRASLLANLVTRRREVVSLSNELERLITENFLIEREHTTRTGQDLRASFGWITVIALLLGMGISAVAWARMSKLERQSQAAESELRRLSGQIRMTQEQERKALSRELHDEVGQLLTGLRMELGGVGRLDDNSPERTLRMESAKRTVEQLIRSIRNIALLLRPSMLDDLGLSAALTWLVKENARNQEFEIHSEVDPSADSLPEAHRTCLYRVVQEALTNVSRHSGARKVEVVLQTIGGWVSASITDDGRGFSISPGQERGLGLIGMEERVKELGGSIRVISSPGRGTRVEIRLPRPAEPEVIGAQSTHSGRPRDRSDRVEASA